MQRIHIVPLTVAVLLGTGCVSKQQFEAVQTELAACQQEKAQSEAQVITWEQRFDREAQRWESMGTTINEQIPQALSDLNAERDRIVKLVPDTVQGEVEKYLDEYFATVMNGFDKMAVDNRDIKLRLDATQTVLENLGQNTQAVSEKIDSTLVDERGKREQEQRKRERVASRIAEVVTLVAEFDNTRVNCKQCPDRLKLKRKEREALAAFHNGLTTQLSSIQAFAASDYELESDALAEGAGVDEAAGDEAAGDEAAGDEAAGEGPAGEGR